MIPLDGKQIRRLNLKLLIHEIGKQADVATRSDTAASYISQILRKKKPRDIGELLARKFETGCNKQHGWMDHFHVDEWKMHGIIADDRVAEYKSSEPSKNHQVSEHGEYLPHRIIHILQDWQSIIHWLDDAVIPENSKTIDTSVPCGDRTYALTIRGDIIAPIAPEHPYIIVDPDQSPEHRALVVVHVAGWNEATFRRLIIDANQMYLQPLNKGYETIKLSGRDYRYCGRVVQMVMNFDIN